MNERITENIVRKMFRDYGYYNDNDIIIEEQQSTNPRINRLLQTASKGANGCGKPEFIISFKDDIDFLIIVECKADITKHESKDRSKYKDYAVDGVLYYSSHISKEYNVLSIAISGETEREKKISHFLQLKRSYIARDIKDKIFLDYNSYKNIFREQSKPLQNNELIKKAIEYNNLLHEYSIPETERCTLISSILVSLQDNIFRDNFHQYEKNLDLIDDMLRACQRVLKKNGIADNRQETIIFEYTKIKQNITLCSDDATKKKKSSKLEPNIILKNLISDLREHVLPFIKENDFDILGRFYREFIRYAGSDSKTGLVLTPSHITDLFCEIANLQYNDIVFDPCCGTGGFLVSAMKYMMNECGNDLEEYKKIKTERIIGIEKRPDMFTHACSNMMMRGDGKSHIFLNDCFNNDVKELVKQQKPNKSFLNPPYDVGAEGQLKFIENSLECLEKNGLCISICQMSTMVSNDKKVVEVRKRLLNNHTLKAVFSMPDDLFYPNGVVTCIIIFEAHIKHQAGKKTFLGFFKNDGHFKKKNQGRIDAGEWNSIKAKWLNSYQNMENKIGFSVTKELKSDNEWCAEAYMETDFLNLKQSMFVDNLKKYLAYKLTSYTNNLTCIDNKAIIQNNIVLEIDKWEYHDYNKIFVIKKGKRLTKSQQIDGEIPYISSSAFNNGVDNHISNGITDENCLSFACYGSIGEIFYHPNSVWISDNCNAIYLYQKTFNVYIGMFIATILQVEKYRFSYGMTGRKGRIEKFKIKLPTKNKEPDWDFMENYIKSLPYSSAL